MSAEEPDVVFLTDGGQDANVAGERIVSFIEGARRTLELAIYDAHFDNDLGPRAPVRPDASHLTGRILGALDAAEQRGVVVRAIYNDPDGPGSLLAARPTSREDTRVARPTIEPRVGPSFLQRLSQCVPARPIDGRFDLMHHKYVVRDADDHETAAVLTGSANWTTDSFTRMENAILTIPNRGLAQTYRLDFEQLWPKRNVENSGKIDDEPDTLAYRGTEMAVRALFSPGRGRKMSQLIARRIGEAKRRVRICSPVLTSTPILGTVAEVLHDAVVDTTVTVDGSQMRQVLRQWSEDGRAAWKGPLYNHVKTSGHLAEKQSTPYAPNSLHDFMHAKMVVADDWVLTGSFNCSHSGEQNAENLVEMHNSAMADRFVAFIDSVHTRYSHS